MSSNTTVIGASMAGLFAAYRLGQEGRSVRVYEAQDPFKPEPRTLIVTPAWLRLFDFDVEPAILNRTRVFELFSPGASLRLGLREPDIILDRARFLHLLADRVQDVGGELVLGCRLLGIEKHNSSLHLRIHDGNMERQIEAPAVLGADGVDSTVARSLPKSNLGRAALLQAQVSLPSGYPADTSRVWFDRTSTQYFFWLIPESPNTGVAGLIAATMQEAEQALERFLSHQGLKKIALQESASVPLHPFSIHSNGHSADPRILLVGDAAGQVKVTTVGGVVTGMRGGEAAARSLLRRTRYSSELRQLHGELNVHALVRGILDEFTDSDYDRLLGSLSRSGRRVLYDYNRDELVRAMWRLLPAQPHWLPLAVRVFMRGIRKSRLLSPGQPGFNPVSCDEGRVHEPADA